MEKITLGLPKSSVKSIKFTPLPQGVGVGWISCGASKGMSIAYHVASTGALNSAELPWEGFRSSQLVGLAKVQANNSYISKVNSQHLGYIYNPNVPGRWKHKLRGC